MVDGFPKHLGPVGDGTHTVGIGPLPPGQYMVYLKTFEGSPGAHGHVDGNDERPLVVEDCSGSIIVLKVDSEGTKMEGVGFTLLYPDESLAHSAKLTDSNGQLGFGMPFGSCIVRETTVPDGYVGAADQAVTLDASNNPVTLTFVNTTTTTTTTTTEEVEVQALTEEGQVEVLAFTGENPIFYIIGLLLLAIAGGLAFGLRAVRSKK